MRFNLFKYICIFIFIVILVVFTVGYTTQPLINLTADVTINAPTVPNVTNNSTVMTNTVNYKYSLYIDKIVNNNDNSTINYKDVDNSGFTYTYNIIKYGFICISVFLGLVIILSTFGLKAISYIPLSIVFTTMLLIFTFLINIYYMSSKDIIIEKIIGSQSKFIKINNTNINFDNGSIMITASTALFLINFILYPILG
jgi:hypothetical protein